jgi:hypothetical protein
MTPGTKVGGYEIVALIGIAEVHPGEVRPAEVCPLKERLVEVRPAEVRPAEVGFAETRPAEVRCERMITPVIPILDLRVKIEKGKVVGVGH